MLFRSRRNHRTMPSILRSNNQLAVIVPALLILGACIQQDPRNPFRVGIASQQLNNPFKDLAPYSIEDRTTPSAIAYVDYDPGKLPPIYRRDIPGSDV